VALFDLRENLLTLMTQNEFRRLALGMQNAIEGAHMGHPDFRANGKIFATLYPDGKQGMVKLTPEQQHDFMREHSRMFVPAPGAWGRGGATMVQFAEADEEVVGEAVTLAWKNVMAKKPPKRVTKKRAR
jgi:YjbR